MARKVMVLVGTTKGAFFFESDENRRDWCMTGPHLAGWEIYSLRGESRSKRIFAGTSHFVYGTTIRVSEDFGDSWTQVVDGPKYSEESGFKLNRIWQIVAAPSEPNTLYAGVEEAGLFVSGDGGQTWKELSGLTAHRTRSKWFPGNGGLCLHTILIDPTNAKRLWVGISAVGCFRSDDGGESWKLCNNGLPQIVTDEDMPEEMKAIFDSMKEAMQISRCVHKIVLDPNDSNTLYMQYHGGVLKSTDAGDSWQNIENGLPGNFGFPIGIARRGDLFVVPLHDESRMTRDGHLRVYRSTDRGASWHAVGAGLPEPPHYVGVLRDALDVDPLDPAGIYFGTTMGEVFYSADDGDRWSRLPGQFPRITTIKTWLLES